ncbi:MAG: DUF2061 domain-containing protein [Rhodospirillaceae bacterium]|nr:DUF2061 domain-containing protein [Rhodospirillaceae bacterium]
MNQTALKTLTFAVLHFMVGFAVSYAFTGSVLIAGGIALVEPAINTVVFYLHETLWTAKTDAHRFDPACGVPHLQAEQGGNRI